MPISTNPESFAAVKVGFASQRDCFYAFGNAERNTAAALENYVLRDMAARRSGVVIGCRESFLAVHVSKFFPTVFAVEENAAFLSNVIAKQPKIVGCQIEPDDFKISEPADLILVAHLMQSLGNWLETPAERNHQRLAFLNHYYGALAEDGAVVLLRNRPQNNYRRVMEYISIAPSDELQDLYGQINQQFAPEYYLFPVEINTQNAEDMVLALSYLMKNEGADENDSPEKTAQLHIYAQTLQNLDGNYYFNYEGEMVVFRKRTA